MQSQALLFAICIVAASAVSLRRASQPALKCGLTPPHSEHSPFEPANNKADQCTACKIRACNTGLPNASKSDACRCQAQEVGNNWVSDCKLFKDDTFTKGWESCGAWRDCDALKGQCVSVAWSMPSAPDAPWATTTTVAPPKKNMTKVNLAAQPALKCGVTPPHSEHSPFEPANNKADQCTACKIRACNTGLPNASKSDACRCQAQEVGNNWVSDCKLFKDDTFTQGWESCGAWRDCDALKGQCVSVAWSMPSAPDAPWATTTTVAPPKKKTAMLVRASQPALKCGLTPPHSEHSPFEPANNKADQCTACKIRACNTGLPNSTKSDACRCQAQEVGNNWVSDCKLFKDDTFTKGWESCGAWRDCDALKGQCVSAAWSMPSAPDAPWATTTTVAPPKKNGTVGHGR